MARSYLLNTDVLVDFLCAHKKAVAFVNTYSARIILSPLVVAELYAAVKGKAEQVALADFVSLFRVIPVSAELKTLNRNHYPILKGLRPAYTK